MIKPGAIRVQVREFCDFGNAELRPEEMPPCQEFFWRWVTFDSWRALKQFIKGLPGGACRTEWSVPEGWRQGEYRGVKAVNAFYCSEHAKHAKGGPG